LTHMNQRQTDLAFSTRNLPPFTELKMCRSVAWRLNTFAGDWRQAAAFRHGLEFNHPLLVRKVLASSSQAVAGTLEIMREIAKIAGKKV